MDELLVSVVIPVRNGERYLASAIESVLQQDYPVFEILVVDGQSEDNTASIAESFKQVRYLYQQGDASIAAARNLGIDAAKGEFIAFISHDDVWAPTKLSSLVGYLLRHPETQYTITRVKHFLEPGCAIPPGFRKALLEGDHVGPMPETLVARKSLFRIIGGFNPEFAIGEDNDWFFRARDKNIRMAIIPEVLTHKRVHDANLSCRTSRALLINQDLLKTAKDSIDRKRHQGVEQGNKRGHSGSSPMSPPKERT